MVVLGAGLLAPARAQPLDAGRVLESVQPRRPLTTEPRKPTLRRKADPRSGSTTAVNGPRMLVSGWRIDGARVLPVEQLERAVAGYVGRTLSASQLQDAAETVEQTYRDAGYLFVQAEVLPQTIASGVVTITVREDRLERLDVAAVGTRALPGGVDAQLRRGQPLGAPLNTQALDQTLLRINNLPAGGRVSAEVSAAEGGDASQLDVRYVPEDRVSGQLQLDGHGNRYTGRTRALGQLVVNDPLGLADQFSVTVLGTGQHLGYAALGYRVPLGLATIVDVSLSSLDYELCCQGADPRSEGDVRDAALGFTHDWVLQRDQQVSLMARVYGRHLRTRLDGQEDSNRRLQALALGAQGYWQGSAQHQWSLVWHSGSVKLDRNPADAAADAAGRRTEGRFSRLAGGYSRQQALDAWWSWGLSLDAQSNLGRNLESSERFSLGGADGVRAYAAGEAAGDSGLIGSLEVRRLFAGLPGLSLAAFLDAGHIRQNTRHVAELTGASPNSYGLSGGGLALRMERPGYHAALSVAHPFGHNPGEDASGRDSEGLADRSTRWWLAVGLTF